MLKKVNSAENNDSVVQDSKDNSQSNDQRMIKNVSLEEISINWKEFVSVINSERPSLGSSLDHSNPTELDQKKLTVSISGLPEFSVNNLNHNKSFIEASASKFFKVDINLHFLWDKESSQDLNLSNESPDISDSSENADKIVESIIEEFDGEILR